MQTRSKHIATNSFTQGMKQDRAYAAQDSKSYREAWNGNIVFSGNGDAAFCNEPGNSVLDEALPENYISVMGRELVNRTIVFSTDGTNSEIGILKLTPTGTLDSYTTVFNDAFDPNGDLLHFDTLLLPYPAEATIETNQVERVYWLQPNAEPRCFNIDLGLQSKSAEFTSGNYTPLIATGKYPWFYSVHSMSQQADFSMGRIKLKDTTPLTGSLKTGMYEMTYRMTTRDGYATPWYPLTRHFFVTLDEEDVTDDHNNRSMYASNVMTDKAYIFTIKDVDTRFYQLEVAYVYSTDKDVTVEASIFYRETIDPTADDVDVTFASTTGIAVSMAEFNRYITPVRRAKVVAQKDNRQWLGGVQTYGPYELDLSSVIITPFIKQMIADEEDSPQVTPLTDSTAGTATISVVSYLDNTGTEITESHEITTDFINYKGVQYEHLYSSYWGGETYPFSLVVFDLKGNPFYAQHIRDYTFPNRYDSDAYAVMTDDGKIGLLGLKFSNIDLTPILFDEDGKLQVSGVAIARGKRIPRIIAQGIMVPAVIENEPGETELMPSATTDFHPSNPDITDALKYDNSNFVSNGQVFNSRPYTAQFISPDLLFERNIFSGTQQDDVLENVDQLEIVGLYSQKEKDAIYLDPGTFNKWYTKNYEPLTVAGDKLIEFGTKSRIKKLIDIETFDEQDQEWHAYDEDDLSLVFKNDANIDGLGGSCASFGGNNNLHAKGVRHAWLLKTKDFKTLTYYGGGNTSNELFAYYVANYMVHQEKYFTPADQNSLAERLYIGTGHFQPITQAVLNAIITPYVYTWTFAANSFASSTVTITINSVPHTSGPLTTLSGLTTYLDTLGLGTFGTAGNFITVSSAVNVYGNIVINTPVTTIHPVITGHDKYILQGAEVWGGDCYPWTFDFLRLYPKFSGDCNHEDNGGDGEDDCWSDYAGGMIIPLETSMNIALRRGRNFSKVGIRSETDACGVFDTDFDKGISMGQPEEFYLNSVVMHEGNVQMFVPKPIVVDPQIIDFDYRWVYSNLKIFGEITDQYRVFLSGNFGDCDAMLGKITGKGYYSDYVYCLQERGLSRLRINEIHAISTVAGEALSTGVLAVWQKPAPISYEHGTIHPYAVVNTAKGFYWVDYYNKCFCRFGQDGVTDESSRCELKDWSYETLQLFSYEGAVPVNKVRHIAAGYDPTRKIIYFSMYAVDGITVLMRRTVSYAENERVRGFVAFWDMNPYVFMNANGFMLSTDPNEDNQIWVHYTGNAGQYFGNYVQTELKFVVNPMSDVDKLFDNSWANFNTDADALLQIINWATDTQAQLLSLIPFPYIYLDAVTNSDPGSTNLKFNNIVLANATKLYISETDSDNIARSTLIKTWEMIKVYQTADNTIFATYVVSAITDNGAWDTLDLIYVEGNGALVDTDPVTIEVIDTGYAYMNLTFITKTIQRAQAAHLSGKYLLAEYVFQNAENKKITFTSHDQSYRPIAKIR